MMLDDSTPSLLYTASCFQDNHRTEEDSTAEENMKQPLIVMSNVSMNDEEPSRSILCIQSFLFGSFITFMLQGVTFAACTLVHNMFGNKVQNPPASGWPEEAVIFVILYPLILYTLITKLYMQKQFDKEDPRVWTERILLIIGVYFAVGAFVGSTALWMIVFVMRTGIVPTWSPDLSIMTIGWVLFLITVEFSEWSRSRNCDQTTEHELEDDSCFLV
jgi:hypothetical protein